MTARTTSSASAAAEVCRPWLRHILSTADWTALAQASAAEPWMLLAHWADTLQAHALFLDPEALTIVPVSTPVEGGRYPALSPVLPGAAWYERMIHDLWGHRPKAAPTRAPGWITAPGRMTRPMAPRPEPRTPAEPLLLSGPDQDDAMVLPLGPIWGRLDEAAHLRLSLDGPAIRRAEVAAGFHPQGHPDADARQVAPRRRPLRRPAVRRCHCRPFGCLRPGNRVGGGRRGAGPSRGAANRHDGSRTNCRPSRQSRGGRPAGGCPGRANPLRRAAGKPAARFGSGVRPSADDGLRRARRRRHRHRRGGSPDPPARAGHRRLAVGVDSPAA